MRVLLPPGGEVVDQGELEAVYSTPLLEGAAPGAPPGVRVNMVASLDGAVEMGGRSGPLGGPADRLAFTAMRALADVVLVGAGTVRAEGYGPVVLDPGARSRRRERGQAEAPRVAVASVSGDLDLSGRLFSQAGTSARPLVLTSRRTAGRRPDLGEVAEVVVCGEVGVDVGAVVERLSLEGRGRILCEGGPSLLRSLLEADLVEELCLTFSPVVAGGGHALVVGSTPLVAPARFSLAGLLEADGMLITRYARPAPR